jgi:glycerol uptake facilitator-like aquaporin
VKISKEVMKMRVCCANGVHPLVRAALAEFIGTFILVVSSLMEPKQFYLSMWFYKRVILGHRQWQRSPIAIDPR